MTITASRLRENIYRLLNEVAETGVPAEIVRKGVKLRSVAEVRQSKLANLKKRKDLRSSDEELFDFRWEYSEGYKEGLKEWRDFK